ncbi:MAG: zinc-dependent metalloprotease [Micrococcales bacterium]
MSDETSPDGFNPDDFAKFLQELLSGNGQINAEELARVAGLPNDPLVLQALIKQLQQAISQGDSQTVAGVNWTVASQQAVSAAHEGSISVSDRTKSAIDEANKIATLWLDQATNLSSLASEPKLVTREVWVQDALPLFQELAGPIAERVANALTENLQQNLPSELEGLAKGASGIMRSAGGALFAMQLGSALGKLSHEVLTGGDIGLPFYTESRAAFIPQNLGNFITENELVEDQAYIYLSVREMAHARLFRHSRWLREAVITQLTNYAHGITIDGEAMSELASSITPENAEALKNALESGALLAERTEEQLAALQSIETLLALIEGWVEVVTEQSTKLLPTASTLDEVLRRRRATSSPAQATFATLVGLELRPRRNREAAAFWKTITESIGVEARDAIWDHPDLLPTSEDIDNVEQYLKRIQSGEDSMDQALRELLDGNQS